MSIINYIDKAGWRTKLIALSWAICIALIPCAALAGIFATVLATEMPIPLIIAPLAAFVFPMLFIVLWPLLRAGETLGNVTATVLGLKDKEIFDIDSNITRPITIAETLAISLTLSIFLVYYGGMVAGILALAGVIAPASVITTCLICTAVGCGIGAIMYLASQKTTTYTSL